MPETKTSSNSSKLSQARHGFSSHRFWRRFRLWEKKRGDRQTGSSRWGAAGETLFFAGIFVFGITLLTQLFSLRVIWNTESVFTSNLALVIAVLLLGPLIGFCAYKTVYQALTVGSSAERLAAIANKAKENELLAEVRPNIQTPLPTIPSDANLKNSPGIRLAYRLPATSSMTWRLAVMSSFCLLWNGAVAILAVLAINQGEGFTLFSFFNPAWWTLFRIVVFVYAIIGVLCTRCLFRLLLRAAVVGPTGLEISESPLSPGSEYRVFLSQSGHLHINWLELSLVCDEEVSFSDGTDTRSETRRIYEESLFRHEAFEILPSQPFHCECPLRVPNDAMHSFVTDHNAVTWKLVVRLEAKKSGSSASNKTENKTKRKSDRPWSRFWRTLSARWRRQSTSSTRPIVSRVFPVVLHPKP